MSGRTSYTNGELAALVAPVLRCDPDEVGEVIIVGVLEQGPVVVSTVTDNPARGTLAILAAVIHIRLTEGGDLD